MHGENDGDGDRGSLLAALSPGLLLHVALFSLVANLLLLTGPVFMLQVYDRVLNARSTETLVALFALVVLLYAIFGLLDYARSRMMARAAARFHDRLARPVFTAAAARTRSAVKPAGDVTADLRRLHDVLASPAVLALFDLPWTPLFLAAIFLLHPDLGLLAVAGIAILAAVGSAARAASVQPTRRAIEAAAAADRVSGDILADPEACRALGLLGAHRARWTHTRSESLTAALAAGDRGEAGRAFSRAFRLLLQSAMVALAAWLALAGSVTPGAMIAAAILMARALTPVDEVLASWGRLAAARAAWRRLERLLDDPGAAPATAAAPAHCPGPMLAFDSVSALHGPGLAPALIRASFVLAPGEVLGVIGRSGAGKTALARAATGLLPAAAGKIRICGIPPAQFGIDGPAGLVGYLPQEMRLFPGTLAENIARFAPDTTASAVAEAAVRAGVHAEILALPEGYDTPVWQSGASALPAGLDRRVGLARALFGAPRLLVLDDPAAALDDAGMEALQAAVEGFRAGGGAALILTNRPTAVAACDRLMVLDRGRIASLGPRDDIIRTMLRNADDVHRILRREAAS